MAMIDKDAFFQSIAYTPHPEQAKFHESKSRFRVPVCGRRFGKSTMAARDLEVEMFAKKKRFWIVGPTYNLGEKEFRVIWDDLIIGRELGHRKDVKRAYNLRSGEMYIELPWGTRVEVRSATHPEALVGDALHGVILSEAAKHNVETWERYIRPALTDFRGWATFPTTPEGQNWLYNLWLTGQDDNIREYASWRFPSWLNTFIYPEGEESEEIQLLKKTTTAEWFMQEIGADFASFVGRIYGEFEEQIHVQNHTFNPAWPNYIAFDWGYVRPLAAVEFQVDPQDNVYVWRLHYKAYETIPEHVREMKARSQPAGYKIDCAFGDAADPAACETVSQLLAPCIGDPAAKANWRQGVDLVKRFLKEQDTGYKDVYDRPILKPKLTVDPSCRDLIKEFTSYRSKDGNVIRESTMIGGAQNQDDHALDALRYGLMHIFELGAKHHLHEVDNRAWSNRSSTPIHHLDSDMALTAGMEF
jgi:hypothetical protein